MDRNDKHATRPGRGTAARTRAVLGLTAFRVGVVVLAAGVLFGAWAFAELGEREAPESERPVTLTLDDEFERARVAAESGDTESAVEILERVLAEDPGHERASSLLRRLTQGGGDAGAPAEEPGGQAGDATPGTGGATGPPGSEPDNGTPRDDSAYLEAASDLDALLPQVIPGWTRGAVVADSQGAVVPFAAVSPGLVTRALFAVHDRGSPDGALAFIEDTSKVAYGFDGAAVRIGVMDGYFGTDGTRVATVAFARGRFAFEVVATVPGGAPVSARDAAVTLAREFEAAR